MSGPTLPAGHLGGVAVGGAGPVVLLGVVNVSPESFHAASVHRDRDALVRAATAMVAAGASLIDIGARSTAPGARPGIGPAEEAERLGGAVEALVAEVPVPVSADTSRIEAARAAFEAGARVLNDQRGLRDPGLAALAARQGVGVVLMASPDEDGADGPARTPVDGRPDGPLATVRRLLGGALGRARAAGVDPASTVLDPGIGFFRRGPLPWHAWDVRVLAGLEGLLDLGRPLCVGVSRKSFLGALTGRHAPGERLAASLAATAAAVLGGAAVIRTHDVAETRDAVRVAERIRTASATIAP